MKRELQSQFHKIKMIERRKDDSAASPEAKRKKKSKMKKKRRFSDEQIRSLESIFESESTKLEPRKKMQVATELGLQPRQVAIWFQNKRARWKSKQIEHDYAQLRANYDSLASGFESLIKEKESLLLELQMLNEQLGKSDDEINGVGKDLKRSDWSSSNRGNNNDNNDNNKSVDDFIASSEKWFNEDSGGLLDPSTSSSPQSHWLNFWV